MFGNEYLYILNRLGGSQSDLSIWNYIQYLRGSLNQERTFLSYWRFHDYVSVIGRHFSGVAFRIVLLMALGALAQILYNVSTSTMVTWILAIFPVILSVLILVLPLSSLHSVLRDAKVAVLGELEGVYDQWTIKFITEVTEQRHSRITGQSKIADEGIAVKITSLRGIIEETRQQSTWPIRAPMVFRIIVTALIPVIYFFIEELLLAPWLP